MRLATEKDFQGGAIYTHYPPPPEVYAKRARLFRFFPEPILVVGCGFGGLVQAFLDLNLSAWGMDASKDYCIPNRVSERVVYGDILDLGTWRKGQVETLITDDLLPHLTDDETLVAARNCQALSPIVIHLVTEQGQAQLNYHPTPHWMRLTQQPVISLEGM